MNDLCHKFSAMHTLTWNLTCLKVIKAGIIYFLQVDNVVIPNIITFIENEKMESSDNKLKTLVLLTVKLKMKER